VVYLTLLAAWNLTFCYYSHSLNYCQEFDTEIKTLPIFSIILCGKMLHCCTRRCRVRLKVSVRITISARNRSNICILHVQHLQPTRVRRQRHVGIFSHFFICCFPSLQSSCQFSSSQISIGTS